jgi:RimJ/RimL family protein N-acetyltransferase
MAVILRKELKIMGEKKVFVRSAKPEDAIHTLEIQLDIIKENIYTPYSDEELERSERTEIAIINRFLRPINSMMLVIEDYKGTILATAQVEHHPLKKLNHIATVNFVFVKKKFRGRGIGTALMSFIIDWTNQNLAIEKLKAELFSTTKPAIRLFMNGGFVMEGRGRFDLKLSSGEYVDSLMMGYYTKKIKQ